MFRDFHVVAPEPVVVVVGPPPQPIGEGWHVGVAGGAIAVAASGPASFFTPTVSVSAVRGPPAAEWLHLTAQAGWRPSGPSGPDPVLPSDPRPPFQDRSFRTLSLGATVFPADWWGIAASWVGGWEMARDYDQYLNRSLGLAVGPRVRLLASRRLILGLDLQYAQVSEFELDDPRWRFDVTPAFSFGYVFR